MLEMIKQTGKAASVTKSMVYAAAVSMIVTILLSMAIAHSLNAEWITWEQAGYWIMGMLFAASFISCKCAIVLIKRQRFAISIMSGIVYWGLLLIITALLWGGDFSAVWETAGLIAAGSGCSALITMPFKRKKSINLKRNYC